MPRYDQNDAQVLVFTYKEGLMARMAHDLKLRFERLSIDVADDHSSVTATIETASIALVVAMKDGRENPSAPLIDKRKIEDNTRKDVLAVRKHPRASFRSSSIEPDGDGFTVRGDLELCGRSRPVSMTLARQGDQLVGRLRLNQPDWGIKPFRAMMGTLKIKPHVDVELSVPAP